MSVTYHQAVAFLSKLIGSELCTGAGEDEAATYVISPVVRAFLEGAVGVENVPALVLPHRNDRKYQVVLGEFLRDAGQAILDGPK